MLHLCSQQRAIACFSTSPTFVTVTLYIKVMHAKVLQTVKLHVDLKRHPACHLSREAFPDSRSLEGPPPSSDLTQHRVCSFLSVHVRSCYCGSTSAGLGPSTRLWNRTSLLSFNLLQQTLHTCTKYKLAGLNLDPTNPSSLGSDWGWPCWAGEGLGLLEDVKVPSTAPCNVLLVSSCFSPSPGFLVRVRPSLIFYWVQSVPS